MSRNLRLIERKSPEPLRQYARETIDAVRPDLRQGVLVWRMAERILEALRQRNGQSAIELAHAPQAEQQFATRLAQDLFQQTIAIDAGLPPTPDEIRQYEQRKETALRRAFAKMRAYDWGHQIDSFRPSEPGYELARCTRCGAGVSLYLRTGELFGDGTLNQKCTGSVGA